MKICLAISSFLCMEIGGKNKLLVQEGNYVTVH